MPFPADAADRPAGITAPPASPSGEADLHALLEDGALVLTVEPAVAGLVGAWIPRLPPAHVPAGPARARIHVHAATGPVPPAPTEPPGIQVLGMNGWLDGPAEEAHLRSGDGVVTGRVRMRAERADLSLGNGPDPRQTALHAMCGLTIAAGLLLNRQRKVLLHAGGIVAPDGGAWLLVGDSHSGKSSTCANAIRAGWDFLADDQVVVRRAPGGDGLRVEGWPRDFNLDDGFMDGLSLGRRSPAASLALGPGRWRRSAPLAGLLFPRVDADLPTAVEPIAPAEAMSAVIRQAPWLLADVQAARSVLELIAGMTALPAHRLRLGFDTYREPARLVGLLPMDRQLRHGFEAVDRGAPPGAGRG